MSREQSLLPIRYGRMLVSPFTFYRGAAALMASDLSGGTRTGLHTQLCGDAHLMNFGTYAAPDRRLVFGINDFDETLPGPFEWDVKRLVASFAVAGRTAASTRRSRSAINLEVVKGYRRAMQGFAAMRNLDLWYARLDIEALMQDVESSLSPVAVARMRENVAKARTKDSLKAFSKLTRLVDGEPRIVSDPPLIVPIDELLAEGEAEKTQEAIQLLIRSYRRSLAERPAPAPRAVPLRRHGPQGRRRRQRRHARLDRADARARRRRPAVPPGEGGPGVGPRAVPRQERVSTTMASASSTASG